MGLGFIVFDLADGVQQLLQDDEGLFGMCGSQQGGFTREAHEGVLELRLDETLGGCDRLGGHGQGGERARDHTSDQDGEEFLTDAVGGVAMKLLDMLESFLIPVMGFHRPAPPGQGENRGAGKAVGVEEVGQQHGDRAIGSFQAESAEAQRGKGLPLRWGQRTLERLRGGEPEAGFGPPTARKGLDGGEGGGRWTAHQRAVRVLVEVVEETVTGETAVKEAQAVGGQQGQQLLGWLALITVLERTDGAADRQAAEDIRGRRDQALRGMTSAGIREATLGIERLPHGLGSCSGLQTKELRLANKGCFGLALIANKKAVGPTLIANESTIIAKGLQTARQTHIHCE